MNLILIISTSVLVVATPLDNVLFPRQTTSTSTSTAIPFCSNVASKCAAPPQLKQASSFCSSLVSITTVTNTFGDTTITVAPTCTPASITTGVIGSRFAANDHNHDAVTSTPTSKKVPAPSCFGPSSRISSCNCLAFKTHTTKTYIPTATVTGPFRLQASGGGGESGSYTGFYGANPNFQFVFYDESAPSISIPWILNQDKYLVLNGTHFAGLQLNNPGGNGPVYVSSTYQSYPLLLCGIEEATCALRCSVNLNTGRNFLCYGAQWSINRQRNPSQCIPFTPIVEAIAS